MGKGEAMPVEWSHILVAVSGDEVDSEAIKLACDIARRSKGKVLAVFVIKVKRSLPLDAELETEAKKGMEVLTQAEGIAVDIGSEIETSLIQAREIGPALVDEAIERKADLLIMGMTYRKRFGEFSLGNTVPYVLKNAPCEVILYRESIYPGTKPSSPGAEEEPDR